jgi:hypothetical protein
MIKVRGSVTFFSELQPKVQNSLFRNTRKNTTTSALLNFDSAMKRKNDEEYKYVNNFNRGGMVLISKKNVKVSVFFGENNES